jgi:hypothetical protein
MDVSAKGFSKWKSYGLYRVVGAVRKDPEILAGSGTNVWLRVQAKTKNFFF